MRRVSIGDLDLLLAHTTAGLLATEDRCPHMSAPLSLGHLDGTTVDCVLHRAVIDLATGTILTFPTTGGLGPDGEQLRAWTPAGSEPKPERADLKAHARALTRTRRPRYYPVRVDGGWIEVAVPTPVPMRSLFSAGRGPCRRGRGLTPARRRTRPVIMRAPMTDALSCRPVQLHPSRAARRRPDALLVRPRQGTAATRSGGPSPSTSRSRRRSA